MKKLFFFRTSTDKQICPENSSISGLDNQRKTSLRDGHSSGNLRASISKPQKYTSENQGPDPKVELRRSQSFSSAAFMGNATTHKNFSRLSAQSSSPPSSSSSINAQKQNTRSSRGHTPTPERQVKTKGCTRVRLEDDYVAGKPPSSHPSRLYHDHSEHSSHSSSNVSNEVLDLYIDGEQDYEMDSPITKAAMKYHAQLGGSKIPPRIHFTAPTSPTGSSNDNPRPHSFRGFRGLKPYSSSRDWIETGFGRESPKELAKHVAEKLSQTHSRKNSRDFDSDVPITIDDTYRRSLNKNPIIKSYAAFLKGFSPCRELDTEDELDIELRSKLQKAKDRIFFLSEELELQSFLDDIEINVPSLVQRVKELTEEKISLALEISSVFENQLADRTFMKQQLRTISLELGSRTRKLQNENNDIQLAMEKELDRRSNDWSLKVENFQAEESRLRDRVRELAEQNVSLQKEVSSLSDLEAKRTNMENQVNDLTAKLDSARVKNQDLKLSFHELQDKYKVAENDRVCIERNYREKEEECKDLHKCVTRLLRTCNGQEKTIDGLRGEFTELVQKKYPLENSERHAHKLQLEQIRLTGAEQILRREIKSYKTEVDSLRHENISLLNRLKDGGDEGGLLNFKLDEELRGRLELLQKQGLSLLSESTKICSKLLESLKRVSRNVTEVSAEANRSSLDAQLIMESDMKVQGFRRGIESLMRGLQNVSKVLHEKADMFFSNSQTKIMDDNTVGLQNGLNLKDFTRSELKAEVLLTSLFRETLYAKTQEVEQLQAEVAIASRGNDILKCEVQNALDSLSAAIHRMKELELQMINKEEKIHQLENDLQENTKELSLIRGILPKVTEERDMMWEEVKKHTEKNMLWNSEVNLLKKKIESLGEELLLKEGEITILRDTLESKSFDLLASPVHSREFLIE